MGIKTRALVAGMSFSAVAFISLVASEGYTDKAVIPTKNDVPTVGFGSTVHEDGRRVQMGDTTTPVRALVKAQAHLSQAEEAFRASLPDVALHQAEYDLYLDFAYQYGIGNWRGSSMRTRLLAGEYLQACEALLLYRRAGGRDCSLPSNWGPLGCKGVWTRQQERHAKCMAAQR